MGEANFYYFTCLKISGFIEIGSLAHPIDGR